VTDISPFDRLVTTVDSSLQRAMAAATQMKLELSEGRSRNDKIGAMAGDIPRFKQLRLGGGSSAWSTILFVDLRDSTKRAVRVGAGKTYLTMHALLPALALAVQEHDGYVVGFRGDGLFAAFGISETGFNREGDDQGKIVQRACACGRWMIDGVRKVVNPALEAIQCYGDLRIGVGVDCGTVIFTRIGLSDGYEVTAYGDAVNTASKITSLSNNNVCVSTKIDELFPTSKGGTVRAAVHPENREVRIIEHPADQLVGSPAAKIVR
jgi:adenylate cyclase